MAAVEIPTLKSLNPEKKFAAETADAAPVIEGAPMISAEKPDFSKVAIEPLFAD